MYLSESFYYGENSSSSLGYGGSSTEQLVLDLSNANLRENALTELSKRKESLQDPNVALLLWNSPGTIVAILQELLMVYCYLSPPILSLEQSKRVCNALTLLQCVAGHPDTRMLFLKAKISSYLLPFLKTTDNTRPLEDLRVSSLLVIATLARADDGEVIVCLLSDEIVPLCLQIMETGTELIKPVATYIVQKILQNEEGLNYMCTSVERFYSVSRLLGKLVAGLAQEPSPRLLKYIIGCYLGLCDNVRGCSALRAYLPTTLKDGTFEAYLEDRVAREWLQQLISKVRDPSAVLQVPVMSDHMIAIR